MDDDRTRDERDLFAGLLRVAHHCGDSRDADFDAPLRRDLVRHEREAESIARLELGHRLDPAYAADDGVAAPDLAQLPAHGGRSFDHDRGIHPLAYDRPPLAAHS